MFTARYGLSLYKTKILFLIKGLINVLTKAVIS